jgi:hypothetical protein
MKKYFGIIFFFFFTLTSIAQTITNEEIDKLVNQHRPLNGGIIPVDIKSRLGITHVGGKYCLTNEPYIIEGSKKIQELGFTTTKYFLNKPNSKGEVQGYPFNSKWEMDPKATYIDVLSHPYFQKALDCGQTCVVFNVSNSDGQFDKENADFSKIEDEMFELGTYLLTKYKDREITFIIKNWEGDWMLRGLGKQKKEWMAEPEDKRMLRVKNMTSWFESRQRAITDARKEVRKTKAKIYYGVEANKVIESLNGITGIASDILPKIKVDLVSWSSYDGMNDFHEMYRGIEYLRKQLRPTPYMKDEKRVIIGEIGVPENISKKSATVRWDEFFGVFFALNVPLIIDWELYCNEPKDGSQNDFNKPRTADEMRGFWMLKPDGSKSETALFWEKILNNPGGKFPQN